MGHKNVFKKEAKLNSKTSRGPMAAGGIGTHLECVFQCQQMLHLSLQVQQSSSFCYQLNSTILQWVTTVPTWGSGSLKISSGVHTSAASAKRPTAPSASFAETYINSHQPAETLSTWPSSDPFWSTALPCGTPTRNRTLTWWSAPSTMQHHFITGDYRSMIPGSVTRLLKKTKRHLCESATSYSA